MKTKQLFRHVMMLLIAGVSSSQAAILLWDNGAPDSLLGSANNWNPNQAPAANDTLNVTNGDTVIYENNLPNSTSLSLTNGSTLQVQTTVIRLNGSDVFVGAGSSLTGGSFGFDFGGGNVTFEDGASFGNVSWEQKGANIITFNMGATGFTTLTPGIMRHGGGATWSNATYQVDFADFNGANGLYNIVLADFGSDATGSTNADFQNATFNYLNDSKILTPTLTWSDAQDSVTLTFTAIPEPSSTALLGLGGLALIMRRRR